MRVNQSLDMYAYTIFVYIYFFIFDKKILLKLDINEIVFFSSASVLLGTYFL